MKRKGSGGFSLIETLVAIAILGMVVVPTCTALVMAIRVNEKTDQLLQAQLAVSSAVETLMAEGISYDDGKYSFEGRFDDVKIQCLAESPEDDIYYEIAVSDDMFPDRSPMVTVTTTVRAAEGGD